MQTQTHQHLLSTPRITSRSWRACLLPTPKGSPKHDSHHKKHPNSVPSRLCSLDRGTALPCPRPSLARDPSKILRSPTEGRPRGRAKPLTLRPSPAHLSLTRPRLEGGSTPSEVGQAEEKETEEEDCDT